MYSKNKIVSIILLLLFASCENKEETYKVVRKPLNVAVYASGKIMPLRYDDIKGSANAKILKLMVKPGDTVCIGQTVALLGSPEKQDQIKYLKKQIAIIEKQTQGSSDILQQLKTQINLAQDQYQRDKHNANRYRDLVKDTAVSEQLAEKMQLKALDSYTQLQNLKKQLAAKKQELNAQLAQLKSNLKNVQAQQNENILTSTVNGIVFNINPSVGEHISPNESIMLIGTPRSYLLDLLIDERDITKIQKGQNVLFQTDAYKNRQFKATVTQINPVLEENVRSFRIKAKVLSDTLFYPKASVEANIIIRKEDSVLMIPESYLLTGDSLWIKKGEDKQKVAVKTGMKDNEWVVVKSGLRKGDVVIKTDEK